MTDQSESSSGALVPYKRGFSLTQSAKATFKHFLPGAALGLTGTFALMGGIPGPGQWIEALVMLASGVGTLSLGFGGGLELIRRWLYPDAQIDGRRSFIAGIMSPAAVFIVGVFAGPLFSGLQLLAMLFSVALVSAVLMFFAWLSPTPDDMRSPEYERDAELLENPVG